jgi:UDP-glucose 4-epimerase
MRVMVTGGAGFIGSHVVDHLLDEGNEVHVLDDLSTGFLSNVDDRAVMHELDVRSREAAELIEDLSPDVLFHHAAQMDVRRSVREPLFDADVNVGGSLNVLEACRKTSVERVVYASTGGAVYGEPDFLPVTEDHPIHPISHYGVSKHAVEHYLFLYRHLYDLDYVILRYPNVYGPRQNPRGEAGVTAIFALAYLEQRVPVIHGDGNQERDYLHVSDVARANLLCADPGDERASGRTFNLGWGKGRSVLELDRMIRDYVGTDIEPTFGPPRPEEIRRISLDAGRIRQALGWEPRVALEDGLRDLVDYHRRSTGQ